MKQSHQPHPRSTLTNASPPPPSQRPTCRPANISKRCPTQRQPQRRRFARKSPYSKCQSRRQSSPWRLQRRPRGETRPEAETASAAKARAAARASLAPRCQSGALPPTSRQRSTSSRWRRWVARPLQRRERPPCGCGFFCSGVLPSLHQVVPSLPPSPPLFVSRLTCLFPSPSALRQFWEEVKQIQKAGDISPTVEAEVAGFDVCVRALLAHGM